MSDTEALMWQVESDPWLNPSGGVLVFLDRPADPDRFSALIAHAVSRIPRLFERVISPVGRLGNPEWVPDAEFDLGWHVRRVSLPLPGSDRQALDLATRLLEDPYDRSRPLWQFVLIEGLEGGRGAIFWKLHHCLMDGKAAIRVTELFSELERDAPPRPVVDLSVLIADAVKARAESSGSSTDTSSGMSDRIAAAIRGPFDVARRIAAEAMLTAADPSHVSDVGAKTMSGVGQIRGLLSTPEPAGSTLWSGRSRHRRAEVISLPLDAVKATAKALNGTVNDVFVAGLVDGVIGFHERRDSALDHLKFSFVVSTRTDDAIGGNAFTPTLATCPVASTTPGERFDIVRDLMRRGKEAAGSGGDLMASAVGLAKLLPTSAVTSFARKQASGVDFATSNMRGAPVTVYIAGAKLERNVTLGPVAGTAFNATALSIVNTLDIGLHLDSGAIDDPDGFRECVEEAYVSLLRRGGWAPPDNAGRAGPIATNQRPRGKKRG